MYKKRWSLIISVILMSSSQTTATADSCVKPTSSPGTSIQGCLDTETGEICNVTCDDGYVGPSNITCECEVEYETTFETPLETTFETMTTATNTSQATMVMMTGGPDRRSAYGTNLVNCRWNYDGRICTYSSTPTPKYVTWSQYWTSTGILIFLVIVLIGITSCLLSLHFRGREIPKPLPKTIKNDYAPTMESPPERVADINQDVVPSPTTRQPPDTPMYQTSSQPKTVVNEVAPPVRPRHGKPAPLPKPQPLNRRPLHLPPNSPRVIQQPVSPPPQKPSRGQSLDSSEVFDNELSPTDLPPPDLPPPDLPPPNPPARVGLQPVYMNQEDDETGTLYEEPTRKTEEGFYNDVDV